MKDNIKDNIKYDCLYYAWEDIGAMPEENVIQTVYFCRCEGHSGRPDVFKCRYHKCKDYIGKESDRRGPPRP